MREQGLNNREVNLNEWEKNLRTREKGLEIAKLKMEAVEDDRYKVSICWGIFGLLNLLKGCFGLRGGCII